ncbi:TOM13-domain-containing protein [Hyaloscypha bicolor E]|uniref:TOM13-domain-containing protein n=1 Tax=Hyaloscypha bicolor E TaxID=1095630 RepID=A0A2J6TBY1_9HELO|nr:TOM13-domain-containing protein [Hyaloscypha bicolor E]PMD60537.1 TOM13-domain-containing protein [Hyaloscypha bicolor E]
MSSDDRVNPLTESSMTIPSDSEQYSGNDDISPSPPSSSSSPPMILYTPPTFWGLLRGAAINLLLPFINGLMLGFGELFANEAAFRLGWGGTKVFPNGRTRHPVGPGIEIRDDPLERRRREGNLDDITSLE